uniref:DUF1115 domain-containing protein n=1 Tax=Strongyloides papillosus TaxID=174720 RepID=A0A0N5B7M2_STREA
MAKFKIEENVMSLFNEQNKRNSLIGINKESTPERNACQDFFNKTEKNNQTSSLGQKNGGTKVIAKLSPKISPKCSPKTPLIKASSVSPNKGKRFKCMLTMTEGPISDVHNHIKRALWQRFGINRYSCNFEECTYGGYNLKAIINHQYIIHNIPDTSKANIRDIFEQHKEFYLSFKKQFIIIE